MDTEEAVGLQIDLLWRPKMTICGPQGRYFAPFRDKSITSRQRRLFRLPLGAKLDTEEAVGLQIGLLWRPKMTICGPQGRYFVPFRDKSITSRQRRLNRSPTETKLDTEETTGLQIGLLWRPKMTICGPQGRYFAPFRDKSSTSRQRRPILSPLETKST